MASLRPERLTVNAWLTGSGADQATNLLRREVQVTGHVLIGALGAGAVSSR